MNWLIFEKSYEEFVRLGRNIPGVLFEVIVKGRRKCYLIGDVNIHASNNGRPIVPKNLIVYRYKHIWSR